METRLNPDEQQLNGNPSPETPQNAAENVQNLEAAIEQIPTVKAEEAEEPETRTEIDLATEAIERGEAENAEAETEVVVTDDTVEEPAEEADAAATAAAAAKYTSKADVMDALTRLASDDDTTDITREDIAALKQQFYAFRKQEQEAELEKYVAEGNDPAVFVPALDVTEEQFKNLMNVIKEKKASQTAAVEAERAQNLAKKTALIDELKAISADTDNVNRAFPRVKDIQAEFKAIGDVPPQEATAVWKAYQTAMEQFYDQLKVNKDLRDYDFRKNLELKTLLCEEAEKLDAEEDIVLAFKRLQNLHDEWRQAGPVAKEIREQVWTRFKEASACVNKKYQAFFEERKAKEAANEAAKTAICEQVEALDFEALASKNAWEEMTKTILDAQQQWKQLGFASRKVNNSLFARFRAVCDKFFAAKAEYYRAVKDDLAQNLAKKIALCEKAEALQDSTDWRKTADTLVALQKEWKTIGAVAKKHSDNVWHRFQKACDTFFENRKKNYSDSRSGELANLEAKRAIIEELKAIPADTPRAEALAQVKELQAKWQEIGHVPFREKDKIYNEYRALCDTFYARSRENRSNLSRFEDVIREMGSDESKLHRERERILRAYEIKRNELKTYENNLGFLSSKSKSGDSMMREMERRIQRIKDDLKAIEDKIKLIDEKL